MIANDRRPTNESRNWFFKPKLSTKNIKICYKLIRKHILTKTINILVLQIINFNENKLVVTLFATNCQVHLTFHKYLRPRITLKLHYVFFILQNKVICNE